MSDEKIKNPLPANFPSKAAFHRGLSVNDIPKPEEEAAEESGSGGQEANDAPPTSSSDR